jgi:hypothetical protein
MLVLSVAFVDGMLFYVVNAFLPIEVSHLLTEDPVKVNVYLVSLPVAMMRYPELTPTSCLLIYLSWLATLVLPGFSVRPSTTRQYCLALSF